MTKEQKEPNCYLYHIISLGHKERIRKQTLSEVPFVIRGIEIINTIDALYNIVHEEYLPEFGECGESGEDEMFERIDICLNALADLIEYEKNVVLPEIFHKK